MHKATIKEAECRLAVWERPHLPDYTIKEAVFRCLNLRASLERTPPNVCTANSTSAPPASSNMLHFNSLVRGKSVPLSPLMHISNTDSRRLLSNLVDCTGANFLPITLQLNPQVKTAIPKLTFVRSSQRVLPIEELQISVDVGEPSDAGEYNQSNVSVDSSDMSYLNNGNEVAGLNDSLNPLNKMVLKERIRRMKIGLANKGKVPWNKGRKHTAETCERIRQRTLEALRDPKVKSNYLGSQLLPPFITSIQSENASCLTKEYFSVASDQIKAKISYSLRLVWQERRKSKQFGEKFFLSWEQSIANAARNGVGGQEKLDWDSYNKIKQQMECHQLLLAEEKEKEKLMAISGAKNFMQSWRESISLAAKKGGSGEQELDWGSYKKIKQEMVLLCQLQCTAEKAKAKEIARVKAAKAARIKAIKKVMLTQRRKNCQEKTEGKKDIKIQKYRKAHEGKVFSEVTQEFKLVSKLTKIDINKGISSQEAREGDVLNSIFPTHNKLDIELIKREKMQKEVSLADQIKAARDQKAKLH